MMNSQNDTSEELTEVWDDLVDNFVLMSESITESLPGYTISLVNPANTDNTLLMIIDGVVIYNFAK
jgi:hypothetical protein